MKKMLYLFTLFVTPLLFSQTNIVVSITPQKTFVEKITKDKANISVMVAPGSSPHAYEPKASQMVAIAKADVYFFIGVEFEQAWLGRFKSQNTALRFVDMNEGVERIAMLEHHHDEGHGKEKHEEKDGENMDPHTWTSPKNVALMAKNIYATLAKIEPQNAAFYKTNLEEFLQEISNTNAEIKNILKDLPPKSSFMVFHPSWGYFANDYNLRQIAVEAGGKSPKPKEMIKIIEEAKEEHVKVIFAQPEFSDKSAKIIAKEANVAVVKISPLSEEWSQNLINMAKAIANK
jgi:zinc transport system substrate-binding protein